MTTVLLAGLALGMASSLHCVGMCGPLSLALPVYNLPLISRLTAMLVYQLGRTVTYTALGFVFGWLGRGLLMAGIQQWFSIAAGVFIMLMGILYFVRRNPRFRLFRKSYQAISKLIGVILKKHTGMPGFLLLGLANGLVPCGMLYVALAAAASFQQLYASTGFMIMFGLGTVPAMMAVGMGFAMAGPSIRHAFSKSAPYFMLLAGVILLWRGFSAAHIPMAHHAIHSASQLILCR